MTFERAKMKLLWGKNLEFGIEGGRGFFVYSSEEDSLFAVFFYDDGSYTVYKNDVDALEHFMEALKPDLKEASVDISISELMEDDENAHV